MACTTVQMLQDAILGRARPRAMTRMYGSAAAAVSALPTTVTAAVTALQLDTKLDGIPSQVLAGALSQAKDARLTILEVMAEAIDRPDEMSPYAPRITTIKVPVDKINAIANPQLPKIGERFLGTVVKTTDFGAFVSLLPGRDGLVHISKLGRGKRIARSKTW